MYTYKLVIGNHVGSDRLDKDFNRHLFFVRYLSSFGGESLRVDTSRYQVVSSGSLHNLKGNVKYFEETILMEI
jgi:hypothetical protein